MSLVSVEYLIFVALVAGVYFAVPKNAQWVILLGANYVFYILAGIEFVPFLLFTTLTTYLGSLWLGRLNQQAAQAMEGLDRAAAVPVRERFTLRKRWVLVLVFLLNFGVLGLVKYSGLLLAIINSLLRAVSLPELTMSGDWILPLGISFYTFQAMGYLIDIYRDRAKPERNLGKLALFLSFFPQLVQGPISRFGQLAPQLEQGHRFDYDRVKEGALRILWGFFQKMVIAERAAVISNWVFDPENEAGGLMILLGGAAYSIRVYTDFAGGMDAALGTAQILGIDMSPNFKRPYFAATINEFWRRWHITLGSWFRDYVFYPISLSKAMTRLSKWCRKHMSLRSSKLVPVIIAQLTVFFLIGVWHGSSVKYIAFGLYHGFLIIGSLLLEPVFERCRERLHIQKANPGFRAFQILRTFLLVVLGRVLTMGGGLRQSLGFLAKLAGPTSGSLAEIGVDWREWTVFAVALLVLLVVSLLQERGVRVRKALGSLALPLRWALYLLLIFGIMVFGVYGYGYDSSDFIYRGF